MSSGDPWDSKPSNNPYVPSASGGFAGTDEAVELPEGQTRGMVGQATVLGVLMVVQGVIDCIAAVIAACYAFFMPMMFAEMQKQAAQQGGPQPPPLPDDIGMMFAVGGSIAAIALLFIGIMLIVSGIGVTKFQSRTLAITSLGLGLLTIFTCYCFPTSFLLGIYGLILLLNQPVSLAFKLRSQGYAPKQIQHAFLLLPKRVV